LWFSFKDGYLGTFNSYSYPKASSDTIFAFIPENVSCASIKLFLLNHIEQAEKVDSVSRYVCQGEELRFQVEEGWKEISWSTSLDATVFHEPVFNYKFIQDDIITSVVSNGDGCTIKHITTLLLSQPLVKPDADVYQILKGESVQLNITGGIEYSWQPVNGLGNPNSGTTTASPASTTEYSVSIIDSLGCSTIGKVLILVEETAFIPNLFTPNDDGKNDALKIYGVTQIQNFSLSIYNREGSVVFDTSSIQEAATQGWNGTLRGVDQPPGVYHWKVSGEYNNGQALLLNGKKTGSIILMR
jgi:gliding motility-associated-like protein